MPTRATGAGEQADRNLRALGAGAAGVSSATAEATDRQERSNERQEQRLHQAVNYYQGYEDRKTQSQQFEAGLSLDAAKHGLEQKDPRAQKLQQEMDAGAQQPALQKDPNKLLGKAGEPGMEMYPEGRRQWGPTAGAQAGAQEEASRKAYDSETKRMSAEASLMSANAKMAEALQAKAKGDVGAYKEMSAEAQKLNLKPVENWTGDFDKFLDGTMEPRKVEALFGEQAQADPKLGAAMQDYMANDGNVNAMQPDNRERFNAAWKGRIDMENIKFTMRSGGKLSPFMDLGSPMGRQFTEAVGQVESYFNIVNSLENDALGAVNGGVMGHAAGDKKGLSTRRFRSFEEQNDFMRSEAAKLIITQALSGGSQGMRGTAPGGQAQGGQNGRTPIGEGAESQQRHGASSAEPPTPQGAFTEPGKYDRRGGGVQQRANPADKQRLERGAQRVSPGPISDINRNRMGY